jgi:hypothetical protein
MRLHVKYPLFLPDFHETWISWKFVQWKSSCSMRTDGQTQWHDEAGLLCRRLPSACLRPRIWAKHLVGFSEIRYRGFFYKTSLRRCEMLKFTSVTVTTAIGSIRSTCAFPSQFMICKCRWRRKSRLLRWLFYSIAILSEIKLPPILSSHRIFTEFSSNVVKK